MKDVTSSPTFSLVYTTVRPFSIKPVVDMWYASADETDSSTIECIIAVDEGNDACIQSAESVAALRPSMIKVVINKGPRTCVAGWNAAAAASKGKVIIAIADDFVPPRNWTSSLLAVEPKSWIDEERVLHVDDGYVHTLCTLAVLTRKRYERFGYIFYPKYSSLFSDTEFGTVAIRDGVLIEAMHLLFEHMHPNCGKRVRDDSDLHHASAARWAEGEQIYNFRQMIGFPVDDGPKAVATQTPSLSVRNDMRFAAYMQVTQDDISLYDVCLRLLGEGVTDFFWCEPDAYWSGEALNLAAATELDACAERISAAGAVLRRRRFSVTANRMPGDSRITVETRVRNEGLSWIRSEGFKHILIVDGDELWKPGTLNAIRPYVDKGHSAIATYMIPVIGFPGWPVGEAVDTAVVYIGGSAIFRCCRSPLGQHIILPIPLIIHFTGTRRNMEETIDKHKRSGHYDDPDYLFDLWIKDVLPNIRPGFTYRWPNGIEGLHMYQPKQIWSRVREWLPEELAAIPDSMKKYLGVNAA